MDMNIQMVDLKSQYLRLKEDIDSAIQECIDSSRFIGGKQVESFEKELSEYLGVKHVISCANGTDALQLALMALDLKEGDEVIVPAFTYVATAEVIGLLGLQPVMIDVDPEYFNIDIAHFEKSITAKTKAIVPVHLFGQCSDMDAIMPICTKHNIAVIEDNAQSIGGTYKNRAKAGTMGEVGCTSFFPSKNLGCYGDGGAVYTNDNTLAARIRMTARHGQSKKYYHEIIGVNSRLDTIQANVLKVKLRELDDFVRRRQNVAKYYDDHLGGISGLKIPKRFAHSDHVFHQYTIRVKDEKRDHLKAFLYEHNIPAMIYYPVPLYEQNAFKKYHNGVPLPVTEMLCKEVLSLPIHTEMKQEQLEYICQSVSKFFN
ncbi:MAG: DegT/DnrJ/EryC1/StrS family aminotransferase [Saprospiraceae bacterium]